jgi:hypothetical protein
VKKQAKAAADQITGLMRRSNVNMTLDEAQLLAG